LAARKEKRYKVSNQFTLALEAASCMLDDNIIQTKVNVLKRAGIINDEWKLGFKNNSKTEELINKMLEISKEIILIDTHIESSLTQEKSSLFEARDTTQQMKEEVKTRQSDVNEEQKSANNSQTNGEETKNPNDKGSTQTARTEKESTSETNKDNEIKNLREEQARLERENESIRKSQAKLERENESIRKSQAKLDKLNKRILRRVKHQLGLSLLDSSDDEEEENPAQESTHFASDSPINNHENTNGPQDQMKTKHSTTQNNP